MNPGPDGQTITSLKKLGSYELLSKVTQALDNYKPGNIRQVLMTKGNPKLGKWLKGPLASQISWTD